MHPRHKDHGGTQPADRVRKIIAVERSEEIGALSDRIIKRQDPLKIHVTVKKRLSDVANIIESGKMLVYSVEHPQDVFSLRTVEMADKDDRGKPDQRVSRKVYENVSDIISFGRLCHGLFLLSLTS